MFCDVKAHKLDLRTFPGRLEIPSYTGVRSTQHREVDWLHVWVVLRMCYYIEHTDVFMLWYLYYIDSKGYDDDICATLTLRIN